MTDKINKDQPEEKTDQKELSKMQKLVEQEKQRRELDEAWPLPTGQDSPPALESWQSNNLVKILTKIQCFPKNPTVAEGYIDSGLDTYIFYTDERADRPSTSPPSKYDQIQKVQKDVGRLRGSLMELIRFGTSPDLNQAIVTLNPILPRWAPEDWMPSTFDMKWMADIIEEAAGDAAKAVRRRPGFQPDGPKARFIGTLIDEFFFLAGELPPSSGRSNFHRFIKEFLGYLGEDKTDCSRLIKRAIKAYPEVPPKG